MWDSLRTSTGAVGSPTQEVSDTVLEAHRQATEDLQAKLAESLERNQELDRLCSELHKRVQRITMEAELNRLQAVQDECLKWETWEGQLVQQLRELQSQLSASVREQGEPRCLWKPCWRWDSICGH